MQSLQEILSSEKPFRVKQIYTAWFDPAIKSYEDISTLPFALRNKLKDTPWLVVKPHIIQDSKIDTTKKMLLELEDGEFIETVFMSRENKKADAYEDEERNTVCISSQVGCPMGCAFCATGAMGFKRNLSMEEVVDQVRFCCAYGAISNIVLMGQGEPLLNYDNVKSALNLILKYTEIGETKITLSTVGVPQAMEKMIDDKDFPPVRFALSLHSAIEETRKKIIPSHQDGFLAFLISWSKKYHEAIPSRTHFIGLEYTLLKGINDDEKHLKALITLASQLGRVRINLIAFNTTTTNAFQSSPQDVVEHWHERLMAAGFTSTIRHSQGQDISAACGQLRNTQLM